MPNNKTVGTEHHVQVSVDQLRYAKQ